MLPEILCISGKAQHGKDTLATFMNDWFNKHGVSTTIMHNADLLKYMCSQMFDWDGKKDEDGRRLLQYVGTDIIRKKDPHFWVDFLVRSISVLESKGWKYVLVPDCRFPNEIERFKSSGFNVSHIRVDRPGFDNTLTFEQRKHKSETALDSYQNDHYIRNDSDLQHLKTIANYTCAIICDNTKRKSEFRPNAKPRGTILVDMDDVLVDLISSWVNELNKEHGLNVRRESITEWNMCLFFKSLSREQVYAPLFTKELWDNVQPMPDAVYYMNKLIEDGFKIKVCTASDYRTIAHKIPILLHYFNMITVDDIVITNDKASIHGDVLIDDAPHNLYGGNYYKILMTSPHNQKYECNGYDIVRSNDWVDTYRKIKEYFS